MEKIWLKHYEKGVPEKIDYPDKPLNQLFEEAARDYPDTPAVIFMGKKISFKELQKAIDQFAAALYALGIRQGDRVAIILPNLPQYPMVHYAIMKLGAIIVPTNPLYVERELEHQMNDSGAKVVIVLDLIYPRLKAIKDKTSLENVIVTGVKDYLPGLLKLLYPIKAKKEGSFVKVEKAPGVHFFQDLMKASYSKPPEVTVKMDDIGMLLYTGGTTGVSKGAVLLHKNLVANAYQVRYWITDTHEGREAVISALPFFHSFGMTTCLHLSLVLKSPAVLIPRFDIKQVLHSIQKYKATLFPGVPTMYIAINHYPDLKKYDFSSLRACISGGAALPIEVQREFEKNTGAKLVEGYGLTESSPVLTANPVYGLRKAGSIGIPMSDTEVSIRDSDSHKELPLGEIGELAAKGPQVMKEYWNNPEETAQVLRDGWLYTGDMSKADEDGYFYIVDRKKDMIIASGFNIYPREVEEVLFQHPKIMEAAVVGVPHEYRGETVKAFVILKEGETATEEEIIDFCAERLAKYKVPKMVEFRKDLPKSMIGKVLRRVLLEEEKKKFEQKKSS
ncbi:long-chain-fatty-acid--CoA ligase [bacterium BMS3Abin05]|nr:long-chain-fatty-acid--CoA ligase [bacterium BMS3Abin05]GBE27539.1 long-chain-fatty-acid--CoA ligase [bacterium BMS3Bbin03]HDL78563.1 long-chain fatty acid--CoA ligase [Bacteroidota bacterium]